MPLMSFKRHQHKCSGDTHRLCHFIPPKPLDGTAKGMLDIRIVWVTARSHILINLDGTIVFRPWLITGFSQGNTQTVKQNSSITHLNAISIAAVAYM